MVDVEVSWWWNHPIEKDKWRIVNWVSKQDTWFFSDSTIQFQTFNLFNDQFCFILLFLSFSYLFSSSIISYTFFSILFKILHNNTKKLFWKGIEFKMKGSLHWRATIQPSWVQQHLPVGFLLTFSDTCPCVHKNTFFFKIS